MILGENCKRKPNINYPCDWSYKIIGNNVDETLTAIEEVISGLDHKVKPSNVSKTGKYFSFDLTLKVLSEDERNLIFKNLKEHENILMVM